MNGGRMVEKKLVPRISTGAVSRVLKRQFTQDVLQNIPEVSLWIAVIVQAFSDLDTRYDFSAREFLLGDGLENACGRIGLEPSVVYMFFGEFGLER